MAQKEPVPPRFSLRLYSPQVGNDPGNPWTLLSSPSGGDELSLGTVKGLQGFKESGLLRECSLSIRISFRA